MASTLVGKKAVVIGAGMGGLTAAGALADFFDQVIVLERDTLPSEPVHRAGTPQGRHVHGLLLSGQPSDAIRALEGRVWQRAVPTTAIEDYRRRFTVLSTRLTGGRSIIHVLADGRPEEGFESVPPDLEDVYFGELRRRAA